MKKYLLLICLLLPMLAFADIPKGEKLTKMLWRDIKAKHINKIAHYTSELFQAADADKIFNRRQMLFNLKTFSPIDHYQILNLETTQGEKVITVIYLVTIFLVPVNDVNFQTSREVIDVWKKQDGKWTWASEGYITIPTKSIGPNGFVDFEL
jgi:hypothetical protein